jgi:hypothetical protein
MNLEKNGLHLVAAVGKYLRKFAVLLALTGFKVK